jgi:ankyrin repeat protein
VRVCVHVCVFDIHVNLQEANGLAALHMSAYQGHVEVVRALLQSPDTDINIQAANGLAALHISADQGHVEVVRALLQSPNIHVNIQAADGDGRVRTTSTWP